MAQGLCNNHGKIDAVWKEGTSKAGKNYAFWGCPVKGKDPSTGDWWKCKVEVANTPTGKFEQELDKAAAQTDNSKRDTTITRLAIAKSFIESNHEYNLDTVKEMERYLAWVEGRAQSVTAPLPVIKVEERERQEWKPPVVDDGDVPVDEIPFN